MAEAKARTVYEKLTRETLVLMAGAYFSLDLLGRAGVVGAAPVAPALDPASESRMVRAVEAIESSHRLLSDLHTGIAPRDANLTPQWSAMRQSLDRLSGEMATLRRAVEGSTSATRGLTYELEDSSHRAPLRYDAGTTEGDLPEHEQMHHQSWLERLRGWLSRDSAG